MSEPARSSIISSQGPGCLLGKPITIDRRPTMSEGDMIGAALLHPGFTPLTFWRLTIDRDGLLRQEVYIWNAQDNPKDEFLYEEVHVPAEKLRSFLEIAREIAFQDFPSIYKEAEVTDNATFWLAVRFESEVKSVEAYAPAWWAARGNEEMMGYLRLWGAIHRFAPFQSGYNDPEKMIAVEKKLLAIMNEGN